MSTLGGCSRGAPPWAQGDCFEVLPLSSWILSTYAPLPGYHPSGWHVVNMHAENFEEIVKRKGIKSIKIERIDERYCLIVDPRIPRSWFLSKPCPRCVGLELAPGLLMRHADWFR
jgi:hypothetical protein